MKKISILTCLALFAATLIQQGAAWAEDFGQISTVTGAWTHITEGSTTGFELADDYYYVSEDLTFTNTLNSGNGQGSGMYVQAGKTVHLYIPIGVTLTVKGADASGTTGAGAGILLPSTSTLHIIGGGTLVATGGAAANGSDGGKGGDARLDEESVGTWFLGKKIYCGSGGSGGNGGGGAGAGIGTAGGNGGAGGVMPETAQPSESYADWQGGDLAGVKGVNGEAGTTAAGMGTLYIQSTVTRTISGGAKGNGGSAGLPGKVSTTGGDFVFDGIEFVNGIPIPTFDITDMQAVAGGGGGGGGAGGGSANAIGTGGSGGGGGASGAHGSACAHNSWVNDYWPSVGAGGGAGGVGTESGTESNNGADGATCWFQGDDNIFDDQDNHKPGGTGGAAGTASAAKAAGAATAPQYTVSYYTFGVTPTKTSDNYNVGSSTTITLPTFTESTNYKWVLSIHGRAAGNTESHCAAPNGDVYNPGSTVDLSNIYGAIEFCAVYVGCEINCTSKVNDWVSTAWTNYVAGPYAVVNLQNRKLYRDGYWNTLTLPFSLTKEKLATTCLAGADIRTFKNTSWDANTEKLTIIFSESTDSIKAGVPCIIRWGKPENAPGDVIEDLLFSNVTVKIQNQSVFEDGVENDLNIYETQSSDGLRFQAQIAPVLVTANSRTLLLGANNKLYIPNKDVTVYATHAYFTYTENGAIYARSITLDFGNGEQETTYIDDIRVNDSRETNVKGIFNLNGQRLDAPRKGLNIINGKKVMVK